MCSLFLSTNNRHSWTRGTRVTGRYITTINNSDFKAMVKWKQKILLTAPMLLVFFYILLQLTLRILNISLRVEGNVLLHYNHLIIACPPSAQYASRHCFYNTFRRCFVHTGSYCIKHRDCICLRYKTVMPVLGIKYSDTINRSITAQYNTMKQFNTTI